MAEKEALDKVVENIRNQIKTMVKIKQTPIPPSETERPGPKP